MRPFLVLAAMFFGLVSAEAARRPLLVLSVDGLDHRYLRDAAKLGLKIPNLRRMMQEGAWAGGVIGVVPTVTWPSHTTMITGVPPHVHGILANRRPKTDGGEYYWSASLLNVPTLLDSARKAGLKTAAITWPVTVDAPVDFNLPEYFGKRRGGAMDLASIQSKGTPGLVGEITAQYPSFPQEWMNDRTRALATVFLLRHKKPDLTLVHFVDLDSEAHDNGPFTREANALVEYTDELIGDILRAAPKDLVIALVSDHGFERTDKVVNVNALVKRHGIDSQPQTFGSLLLASAPGAAAEIRKLAANPENGIGREVPLEELKRLAPSQSSAAGAWEPAEHVMFVNGDAGAEIFSKPQGKGNHGLWPTRPDYRSTFLLWGNGIQPQRLPEMQMTAIAARLAEILELDYKPRHTR
jgi:predicted AlkP superfamily pyrophosphatase or phosphodiesterase